MRVKAIKRILWTTIYIVSACFFVTSVSPYCSQWNQTLEAKRIGETGWFFAHFIFSLFDPVSGTPAVHPVIGGKILTTTTRREKYKYRMVPVNKKTATKKYCSKLRPIIPVSVIIYQHHSSL